jgi:hypothetical protein
MGNNGLTLVFCVVFFLFVLCAKLGYEEEEYQDYPVP